MLLLVKGPVDLIELSLAQIVHVSVDTLDNGSGIHSWGDGDDTLTASAFLKALSVEWCGSATIDACLVATHVGGELFGALDEISLHGSFSNIVCVQSFLEVSCGVIPDIFVLLADVLNIGSPLCSQGLLLGISHVVEIGNTSSFVGTCLHFCLLIILSSVHDEGVVADGGSVLITCSRDICLIQQFDIEVNI